MLQIGFFHQYLTLFVWGTQMAASKLKFSVHSYEPIVDYSTVKLCHRDSAKKGSLQVLETICIDPDEFLESFEDTNLLFPPFPHKWRYSYET